MAGGGRVFAWGLCYRLRVRGCARGARGCVHASASGRGSPRRAHASEGRACAAAAARERGEGALRGRRRKSPRASNPTLYWQWHGFSGLAGRMAKLDHRGFVKQYLVPISGILAGILAGIGPRTHTARLRLRAAGVAAALHGVRQCACVSQRARRAACSRRVAAPRLDCSARPRVSAAPTRMLGYARLCTPGGIRAGHRDEW